MAASRLHLAHNHWRAPGFHPAAKPVIVTCGRVALCIPAYVQGGWKTWLPANSTRALSAPSRISTVPAIAATLVPQAAGDGVRAKGPPIYLDTHIGTDAEAMKKLRGDPRPPARL